VAIPSINEQEAIAAFLDQETCKIDALVAEQERLIALLKEKRQAVISQAVTKGLNPNAPMKASGIEWLGQVPAHWEVKRLKYLGEAIIGLTYEPANVTDELNGLLVLRSSNVQGGKITFDDNVYVSSAVPSKLITQVGDILICSRNGSRALIGKNATIDAEAAGLTFGAFMTVFRSQFSDYLSCVFNSPLFEFQSGAFLTSTINQLTVGILNDFEVPFPPGIERDQIVSFISRETEKLNSLITEATQAIILLRERRAALISAAVTGKIDVRAFIPTTQEAA
jgi:type I restriction enzyme S subunit